MIINWLMSSSNFHAHHVYRLAKYWLTFTFNCLVKLTSQLASLVLEIRPTTKYDLLFSKSPVFLSELALDILISSFLIVSSRVFLTDSFWSCFCCSSRAFSFTITQLPLSQTIDLFLLPVCKACAQCITCCSTVLSFASATFERNHERLLWWTDLGSNKMLNSYWNVTSLRIDRVCW